LGLELGADDYITKPFSMRELMARIRTVLKRISPLSGGGNGPSKVIAIDDLRIDLPGHEVSVKGQKVNLTSKEFELLKLFISHPGQVLTREQLLDLVWGNDFYGDDRTVDVHIRWLREKLEDNPSDPKYILTVRGAGYKFARERFAAGRISKGVT
jgi:DNA-binding response OmpR family regulator